MAVFVKVAFETNHKTSSALPFCPDLHIFVFFETAQVYLRIAGCRVYEGHLQNE